MRPNFFVNTPDILHAYLQYGGPPAFKIRAVLAATGSPTWGVYSGYELFEHVAVRPGSEEYLDSEKYQYRPRDCAGRRVAGRTLAPYLHDAQRDPPRAPGAAAAAQPAASTAPTTEILSLLASGDRRPVTSSGRRQPRPVQRPTAPWHLDLPALGSDGTTRSMVADELTGARYTWGQHNYVRLDPYTEPAHIFVVYGSELE